MRKKLISIGLLLGAIAVGAVAWGYYAGSGASASTQVAAAGTAPVALTVTVASGSSPIYPGENAPISGAITYSAHPGHVSSVSAALDTATLPAGCLAAWFTITQPTLTGGPQMVTNGNPAAYAGGTLNFNDSGTDQSVCTTAALKVIVTAS